MRRALSLPMKGAVIGTALSIVTLVWIFVAVQIRYERREAIAAGVRANVNRAMALEQYVARTLEGADLATAYVVDLYADLLEPTGPPPPAIVPVVPIDDLAGRSPALREINLVNRDGDLVATSVTSVRAKVNVFATRIFQEHRANASTALRVNPPSRSRFLHSWFLLLSRRVNLRDGSFGGTVSVQIRPSELTNFLQRSSLSATDMVSVIGFDGILRARRIGNISSFGQDLSGREVMRIQARNPNATFRSESAPDGVIRYFSHRRLSKYGIFVTSGVAEATILNPVRSRGRHYIAGAILISLVTMLAAWLVLTLLKRRIMREAEIVAANMRLREAQKLARLGEWSFDPAREEFLWSEELCATYERPSDQRRVTITEFGELVGQAGLETFRFAVNQMQAFRQRQEFELTACLGGGVLSHRRIVAAPDLDADGRLVGIHGTDQDVTPRKLLQSLQEQVSYLARIDALNVIAATLAHELNQPLSAASNYLSGSVRMLSHQGDLDKSVLAGAMEAVSAQIHNAGEIIRRVRDLVIDRHAKVEAISLEEVIEKAVALAEAANPGGVVSIVPQTGADDRKVLADPVQLQQVLVNLIRNAREACHPREPAITITKRWVDGRRAEVCVIDDGPGISSAAGDVFARFKTSGEGLGVGLAICRTLIELMGGTIWVAQTGPTGTNICFSLQGADEDVSG
jgi:C4-dicarboxylate-specific signal transduction histidine kinase